MAGAPPDLPETIVVGTFSGVKNIVTPERLQPADLEAAVNVDLDNAGQSRRRQGYTLHLAGNCHSVFGAEHGMLMVKDGQIGTVQNGAFFAIGPVGDDRLSYAKVGATTYFSSRAASGKIDKTGAFTPWGEHGGAGQWVSPVVVPTDLLGAIRGRILGPPPLAEVIEAYSGRIYMGLDTVIWATELFLYDKVDRTKNYLQMEKPITAMISVDDGLYVGTEGGLFFLQGVLSKGMQYKQLTNSPVVRGSACRVPADMLRTAMNPGPPGKVEQAGVILADDGIYGCFAGGDAYNMTRTSVAFPHAERAAVLFRQEAGVNSYVVAADSAGGPSANARIGDYVEAEIRRFQGG